VGATLSLHPCGQVLLNHRRQSTAGWNVWNVLMDFCSGALSLLQVLLDCGITGDWSGIAGNPVKFGLGLTSMAFDVEYMLQHYWLYAERPYAAFAGSEDVARACDARGGGLKVDTAPLSAQAEPPVGDASPRRPRVCGQE